MRLIDADELNEYIGRESLDTREKIFALVDRMPTLPNPCGKPCAFERPHGEWKYAIVDCYKSGYICTHCNGFAVIDGKSDGYSVTFCPNCGSNNRKVLREGDRND